MQRLLLSCDSLDEGRFFKRFMEAELPYQVLLAADRADMENSLKTKSFHLLIMQTKNVGADGIRQVLRLRNLGFSHPVIMLCDPMKSNSGDEFVEKHKIYLLEKPFELNKLKGLTRKLMTAGAVPQQIFRRYTTNVEATIENFVSGAKLPSSMLNLSKGGAYFELHEKPGVSVGDLLRFKISLSDLSKDHHVHGRVVWVSPNGSSRNAYGLGVRFMKASEMYRSLLNRV